MEFMQFKETLQQHFATMTKDVSHLFEVNVDKDELWNLYLDSFPEGANEIYRERREHDCSCCRQFVKNIGNAVVIKENKVHTIWDVELDNTVYKPVADALSKYVKSHIVSDIYVSKEKKIGTNFNYEDVNGKVHKWDHFYLELEDKFVDMSSRSQGDIKGEFRDTKNVFKRSLDEITMDAIDTILELINSNTLYKGEEWKTVLTEFRKYKKQYDKLSTDKEKELYAWENSIKAGISIGRIRNHSIGTLLINVSEDMDLDLAVKKYEQIVAPSNYKRPKAIFTKKMLEEAKNTIADLGYMDSLQRRFATLDDITVNNILFSNKDSAKRISGIDNIFSDMEKEIAINPKKFSKVEEVSITDFVNNILPTSKEIEVLFENRHVSNMVSLIAPEDMNSKTMFKWNNGFSWAYSGNITDSNMRENVKSAGGNVDGVLRFSIQWNDEHDYNPNDFDARCSEPTGNEIYYNNKGRRHYSSGMLDVDIINPIRDKAAVENITWSDKSMMPHGTYKLFVHCYSNNGGKSGFKSEIEFDGTIYTFEYNKALRENEKIQVAEVTYDGVNFKIKEMLPSNASTREIWNLKSNQFVPVSVIMFSPNYWDEQDGIGHRHYFFMLKDCVNQEQPNGFYNEFLKQELVQHKRVFEALGSKMSIKNMDDQLSGIGFSSTKRNNVLVKVKGAAERIMKVKF